MSSEPIKCCESLSCKSMYFRSDELPGRLHEGDTSVYTCFHTQSPVGPDGAGASPSQCQPKRSCYEEDVE